MSSLSMVEAQLPPGFRFHPKDEELICNYLIKKIEDGFNDYHPPQLPFLLQVDLNSCEPWDLPGAACVGRKEWYFYSKRDRKYATGFRTNRATMSGYWKATGKDKEVMKKNDLVGMRKTLVFYEGRAPKGIKTTWVMHEFRLHGNSSPPKGDDIDWVLCRVFDKKKEDSAATNQAIEIGCVYNPPLKKLPFDTFDQTQLSNHLDQYLQQPQDIHNYSQNNLVSSTNMIDNGTFYFPDSPSFGKCFPDCLFTEQFANL